MLSLYFNMEEYQIIKKGSRWNGIDERGVDEMGRYWEGETFFYKQIKTDCVEEDNV